MAMEWSCVYFYSFDAITETTTTKITKKKSIQPNSHFVQFETRYGNTIRNRKLFLN